ncbi:DUF378 domain-containing protein [Candidatus Gracilibacteria bacterium]|nr:DUF378 domain-containing protein [Candidatus Gracilibacteria bacterium]NUJ98998.1 DUF378 domain-containing protein [Candidatus Gracilibacteria bacterium]
MKVLNAIALILLVIGGLNWGLVGVFNFDLVASIFGAASMLSNIVYTLVGVSAIYSLIFNYKTIFNLSK